MNVVRLRIALGTMIALAWVVFSVVPSLTPVAAQPVDRRMVILRAFDAFNHYDVEALLSTYSDNALFVGGAPCLPGTPCVGKAAFRRPFEAAGTAHASLSPIVMQVRGSVVTGRFEFRADAIRAKGVGRIIDVFLAEVPTTLITTWVAVPDFGDPETAKFFGVR